METSKNCLFIPEFDCLKEYKFYFPYNNLSQILEKNKKKNLEKEKEKQSLKLKEKESKKLEILT